MLPGGGGPLSFPPAPVPELPTLSSLPPWNHLGQDAVRKEALPAKYEKSRHMHELQRTTSSPIHNESYPHG